MVKHQIIEKLRDVLTKQPFVEEAHVLYLMVGVRKILEHYKNNNIPISSTLNFYCDWALHIRKDRKQNEVKNIIEPLYLSAKEYIEKGQAKSLNDSIRRVIYFRELERELIQFLESELLPNTICYGSRCWEIYVEFLCSILSHHPINKPTKGVKSLVLFYKGNHKIAGRIDFTTHIIDPKGGKHSSYEFEGVLA